MPKQLFAVATPPSEASSSTEATLTAVGDIMMHKPQTTAGYRAATKSYSFDHFFTEVKEFLEGGDWVIGNLETPLAGAEAGYSGYPRFNAPAALAQALKKAGFNILVTANNHTLDQGKKGLLKTLAHIQQQGLQPVGTASSPQEAAKVLMVEKRQIKMGILAYTYGTNGIPIPKGQDYLVTLIDKQKIKKDIAKAQQLGADIVTVALHFGTEYQRKPNTQQKSLVAHCIQAGADIVLGSHPHVVQPYEVFELTEKSGKKRKAVAIYSLGNFISNQRQKYRALGLIFNVKVRKEWPQGTTSIIGVDAVPTWVHRYQQGKRRRYRILPLEKVLVQKEDPLLTKEDHTMLTQYLAEMSKYVNSYSSKVQKLPPNSDRAKKRQQ